MTEGFECNVIVSDAAKAVHYDFWWGSVHRSRAYVDVMGKKNVREQAWQD